jgi:hypothetical protein
MNTLFYSTLLAFLACAAAGTIDLGSAGDYAILAGSTITLGGDTTVTGKLGLAPGTSIIGVLPGDGIEAAVTASFDAKKDLVCTHTHSPPCTYIHTLIHTHTYIHTHTHTHTQGLAYVAASTAECDTEANSACKSENDKSAQDLGDMVLAPGVYTFAAAAALNGALTLEGTGASTDEWIFQIGSSMLFAADSKVVFSNAANTASQVTWQVSSSASIMAGVTVSIMYMCIKPTYYTHIYVLNPHIIPHTHI